MKDLLQEVKLWLFQLEKFRCISVENSAIKGTFYRAIAGFHYWVSTAMQQLPSLAAHLISEGSVAHVS